MATPQGTGSGLLLAVAVVLAAQVPTTIAAIPSSTTRSVVQVVTLLAVVVCATLVRPREVATLVKNSLRPPAAKHQRVVILPPRSLDVSRLDGDVPSLADDDRPSPTPNETPTAKGPLRKR